MLPTSSVLAATVAHVLTLDPVQQSDVGALRSHLVDLEARLKESNTHRDALRAYVAASPPAASLPPGVAIQMNRVDLQIRQLDLDILNLQSDIRLTKAQIEEAAPSTPPAPVRAAPAATPGIVAPTAPAAPPRTSPNPDVAWLGIMLIVLLPVAIAIAWRIARGGRDVVRRAEWLASEERVQRIEEAVEGIAKDVGRMAEGQRFLTHVLAEGPAPLPASIREREPVARDAS